MLTPGSEDIIYYDENGKPHTTRIGPVSVEEKAELATMFDELGKDGYVEIGGRKIYWPKPPATGGNT